jgi:aldose 1-epimerase
MEGFYQFVQVFTGDTLPDPAARRRGVAIEPMTCAPNAFNSGEGLRVLAPGETWSGRWWLSVK